MPATLPPAGRFRRLAYLLLAWASLACAVLGVILPGLPATEFVLLAAWASAKGSPRLHRWLLQHRLFGALLRDWQAGTMARRSKYGASLGMLCGLALLVWHQPPAWLVLLVAVGMAAAAAWLWRRPEPAAAPPRGALGERH